MGPGVGFESGSTYVDLAFSLVIVVLISAIIGILRAHYVTERVESIARDRVIGIVSHDLRNPLTAIQTYAHLLLSDKAKDPSEVIQGILRSVERMQRIIGDLLDANRIAAGNFSIEKQVENVKSILDDAIGSVRFLAESKRVQVHSKISSNTLTLNCDRARLIQSLSNLLQNAIKFSNSGGQVAVALEDGATAMTFVVEDEGRGIAESDLPFVFDQYWTMKAGNPDGAGLGLFIVRGIARSHGGEIFAQNKTLGKGAIFSLVIPKD